jgi:hypothetical protein
LGFFGCGLASVFVSVWCFAGCLLVFCGAFLHGLWCGSKLVSVKFVDVEGLCGKTILREEGVSSL